MNTSIKYLTLIGIGLLFFSCKRNERAEAKPNVDYQILSDSTIQKSDSIDSNLTTRTWMWKNTWYNDDTEIKPADKNTFSLALGKNGRFYALTNCDTIKGSYAAKGGYINFKKMTRTNKGCSDGGQAEEYYKMIEDSKMYLFDEFGNLTLNFAYDTGGITFE